jgi:hypothetical protein
VVNSNLEDYKVFTNPDVPEIIPEMVDLPDPLANNLGVKRRGRASDHPHGSSRGQRRGRRPRGEDQGLAHHPAKILRGPCRTIADWDRGFRIEKVIPQGVISDHTGKGMKTCVLSILTASGSEDSGFPP